MPQPEQRDAAVSTGPVDRGTPAAASPVDPLAVALGVLCLVMLAVMLAPMPFAWPAADDFQRAAATERSGPFIHIWREYFVWSGRWAAHVVNYGLPAIADLRASYPAALATVVAAAFLLLAAAAATVPGISRGGSLLASGGLLALVWAGHPDVGQTFYWRTGAVENLLSPALIAFGLATAWVASSERGATVLRQVLGLAAMAAGAGMHELYGLLQVGAAAIVFAVRLGAADRLAPAAWALGVAVAGFLLVYLAPGNDVRAALVGGRPPVSVLAILTAAQVADMARHWLADPRLWAASLVALAIWRPAGEGSGRYLLLGLTGWLVLMTALVAAASWALGDRMPARTWAALHLAFLIGWFACLGGLLVLLPRLRGWLAERRQVLGSMGAAGLLAGLLLAPNIQAAAGDADGRLSGFRRQMLERDRTLTAARLAGEPEAVVMPVDAPPRLFSAEILQLSEDPAHPFNVALARFYHLQRVRLGPAPPTSMIAAAGEPR